MISISKWYSDRAVKPLTGLIFFAVMFSFIFGWYWVNQEKNHRLTLTKGLYESISIAVHQKNRVAIESLLSVSRVSLDARAVGICKGPKTLVVSGGSFEFCRRPGDFWHGREKKTLNGSSDMQLVIETPVLRPISGLISIGLCVTLFLMTITYLIVTLKKRILQELVEPLRSGFEQNLPIPIQELEQIRKDQALAHDSKLHKELYEGLRDSVGIISHSLNSPLSFLSVTKSVWADSLPKYEYQIFKNAVERVLEISLNLKNFKKQNLERLSPTDQLNELRLSLLPKKLRKVDLRSSLEEIIFEKAYEYKDRGISFDLEPGEKVGGMSSKFELQTVLSDILNNSAEALRPDDPREIKLRIREAHTFSIIEIQDFGCGISSEDLPWIFSKSYTSGKSYGSGIGLYNAKRMIEKMNGKLEIQSQINMGTIVSIHLRSPLRSLPTDGFETK